MGLINRNSVSIRLLIIALLVLVMMIPAVMIGALIHERENRNLEATREIASKWAAAQTVGGPVITVPYAETVTDAAGKKQPAVGFIQFLPDSLAIDGIIRPEIRYRGIFKAILYNTRLTLRGRFTLQRLEGLNLDPAKIQWNNAFIAIYVTDLRGIKDPPRLLIDGRKVLLEPGVKRGNDFFDSGVSAALPLARERARPFQFSLRLNLNGSQELNLLPLGRRTAAALRSSWNDPSFDGAFLPESHRIGKAGFRAAWRVLDLNRNYPQQWLGATNRNDIFNSRFGVKLFTPVTGYTKTARAVKYLFMFVGLTFMVFFLVEVFNKKRIHPIQYLLIGLSLCIFYILLLSLGEHLSFEAAYLCAGLAITILITFYVRSALASRILTLATAGLLLILYGFMYVLLQNQDYALLLGSIGIFVIMALVMYFSRKVDWYEIEIDRGDSYRRLSHVHPAHSIPSSDDSYHPFGIHDRPRRFVSPPLP